MGRRKVDLCVRGGGFGEKGKGTAGKERQQFSRDWIEPNQMVDFGDRNTDRNMGYGIWDMGYG